jgi:hypothetical protein
MTQQWVKSGDNWMWATWVGDTQVVYLALHDTTLTAKGQWWVLKKVSGADPHGYGIGANTELALAQKIAELDAEKPL